MFSVGIDSGSVATKGILFNGKIVEKITIPTGWSPRKASEEAFKILLEKAGIERKDVKKIIGTGYGRISMDFVDKTVTEITCHAKGVHFLNNDIRTVIDIGGQDSKVISLDENGNVLDFLMNDKCAAGTGRFLQVMINLLGEEIEKLDKLASNAKPESITSMCTVFAESEVVSLLANGTSKESIAAGIIQSIANRATALLDKINISNEIAFTGGVAKSKAIKKAIEEKIKKPIYIADDTQIVGALGAAVLGWNIK
ncbi:2-hydroxyglutaryl-CoA dehydratase [Crassaminicella thermophila]|uniref:2-hydroxyglutaryl-CoA dehydratase n=1 Tax=Crassaminicella thermophila TaxID=2599308 RepID=A0A5C0SAS9_CRATE|nr:acyl-CoA dehydratase activase [Crassaminicella thermophila]QEK11281.1 2-hydroxyglutaryl-CoA dehydratase [Crassaminicella thermophila]